MKLQSVIIQGEQPGSHLLITGGVHGDEFEPLVAAQKLIQYLEAHKADFHGTVTLIPIVNEAAFANCARTGPDGLDLARTCPGSETGGPTEQVAAALSKQIEQADYYIDLHTGGTCMAVFPLTGYMLHKNESVCETSRRMAHAFGLPVVWGTNANLDGRSMSVARDANVPAIYTEYLGGGPCSRTGVVAYIQGCLNVMHELELWQTDVPEIEAGINSTPQQLTIEDNRPSAGHMQICHPAPMSGLWIPEVELGNYVEVGQRIGTVTDPLGAEIKEITADHNGLILVLRTYCRVEAQQSVAVILEPQSADDIPKMKQIMNDQHSFMHSVRLDQLID